MEAAREAGVLPAAAAWAATATVQPQDAALIFNTVAQLLAWVRENTNGRSR